MRHRAFPGSGPEVEARYERAGQWLLAAIYGNTAAWEWCRNHEVPVRKAQSEGIGAPGGFLVPNQLANAILDLRDMYGAFRRRARVVPMASDNVHVPRRPGGIGATFMGENTGASETSSLIDNVVLSPKKIGSLVRISSELEQDSISDMVDFIANEIALAFAIKEDDCAFNGDGTSSYGGMVGALSWANDGNHTKAKVIAATSHNTFLTLDTTDLGSLIGAVRAAALPNAAWFCSATCFAQTFCRLGGSAGGGYIETRTVDGIDTPFYLGFPVILTQKLPLISTTLTGKGMLAFGDMYLAGCLGQRRTVTMARSPDRYMDQDQIGVLGTERFDAVIHDMGDTSNFGALAVLFAP